MIGKLYWGKYYVTTPNIRLYPHVIISEFYFAFIIILLFSCTILIIMYDNIIIDYVNPYYYNNIV